MGGACSSQATVVNNPNHDRPAPKIFVTPDAIQTISGVDVPRDHPWYQHALFCATRLMESYKQYMFPDIAMSLGSFREDLHDYLDLVSEIYNDLCFEERLLANGRVNADADARCKDSVGLLAYMFWKIFEKQTADGQTIIDTGYDDGSRGPPALDEDELERDYRNMKSMLQEVEGYKYNYEDTLKMLTTDLERKEIWQLSTLFSNKEFDEYLKKVEPKTHQELTDDSLVIQVPRPLRRKSPAPESSSDTDVDS